MSKPELTEAGRALLEDWASGTFALDWAEAIRAIEAEARAPLREALAIALRALDPGRGVVTPAEIVNAYGVLRAALEHTADTAAAGEAARQWDRG